MSLPSKSNTIKAHTFAINPAIYVRTIHVPLLYKPLTNQFYLKNSIKRQNATTIGHWGSIEHAVIITNSWRLHFSTSLYLVTSSSFLSNTIFLFHLFLARWFFEIILDITDEDNKFIFSITSVFRNNWNNGVGLDVEVGLWNKFYHLTNFSQTKYELGTKTKIKKQEVNQLKWSLLEQPNKFWKVNAYYSQQQNFEFWSYIGIISLFCKISVEISAVLQWNCKSITEAGCHSDLRYTKIM